MERWRQELYHSVKGSEWEDHKYIAIVNGKYIYPEDVKNAGKNSYSNKGSASLGGSGATTTRTGSSVTSKKFTVNHDGTTPYFKGNIADASHLPKVPSINDVYYLADTKSYVIWDGNNWKDYVPPETKKSSSSSSSSDTSSDTSSSTYTGSSKKKKSSKSSGVSKETTSRARTAVSATKSKRTVKLYPNGTSGSSVSSSSLVSTIKNTSVYKAGVKLYNKWFGSNKSSGGGGGR